MADQPHAKTQTFSIHDERDRTIRDKLTAVYQALQEHYQSQKCAGAYLPD